MSARTGPPVDGEWQLVIETPVGRAESVLVVSVEGELLTGSHALLDDRTRVEGTALDNALSWTNTLRKPFDVTLECTARVSGDRIVGAAYSETTGLMRFAGTRVR